MDFKDESVLNWVITLVEDATNQDRIRKHEIDYEISFGDQKRHIQELMMKKYTESWDQMTVIQLKIANKIIRKLSRCYASGVVREIIDTKTKEKHDGLTNLFEIIYSDIDENNRNFNMVMAKVNEYFTNHRYVELFTYIDFNTNKLRFRPLPQNLFTAIPNETKTEAIAIVFKQEKTNFTDIKQHIDWESIPSDFIDSEVESIYTLWSKDDNFNFVRLQKNVIDENNNPTGEIIYKIAVTKNDSNPEGINPYNILPFAQVRETSEGKYYPYGSEIAEMSKELNVIFSDIASIASNQGFGQAVIYYDGDDPPAITKSGPTHIIKIPNKTGNSRFEFANPNPDLRGHLDIALAITRLLLTTNDLTTDKVSGELNATNFASAIDRLIADSETIENVDDQRKKYVAVEKKQFIIMMKMLRYLNESGLWPQEYPRVNLSELDDSKYSLAIHFNSIKPLTTEKEKIDTITLMEEKGLILPHEKHLRFNESLSEKEAVERESLIQKAKLEKMKNYIDYTAPNNIIENEEEDDANRPIERIQLTQYSENRQRQVEQARNIKFDRQKTPRERNNRANTRENEERDRGNATR